MHLFAPQIANNAADVYRANERCSPSFGSFRGVSGVSRRGAHLGEASMQNRGVAVVAENIRTSTCAYTDTGTASDCKIIAFRINNSKI